MKPAIRFSCMTTIMPVLIILFSSFFSPLQKCEPSYQFPYRQAGLTERQAAAHLLSRFTYGATPKQVESVVSMGLENWFQHQLNADMPDDTLNQLLSGYETLQLSNTEIVNTYPRGGQVLRMAIRDGVINRDSISKDKKAYKQQLAAYMQQKGLKPGKQLVREFISQKIIRAVYSENQLQEVLTEFWFNHFNVSFAKNGCAQFIPAYERDVIRPNVLTNFENLLIASAKSPAMLTYLDNFISSGTNTRQNNKSKRAVMQDSNAQQGANQAKRIKGLNENYAREVMELHTLGVDGGYTQTDVTQAARVLTGWTIYPMSNDGAGRHIKKMLDQAGAGKLQANGSVHDGDFLFAPNRHDDGEKTVLGQHFEASGGYEEGIRLLKMLAHHQSTANFISRKIAVRFVSDNPPQILLEKMAKTFKEKDGDIRQLLIMMVTSPEFWSDAVLREKTKSPFELAVSALRSLDADVDQPYQLFNWINRMGQRMYYYQAPTGFPDKGQYWINTGSLLNRMNFGLALTAGRIPGITFDLLALNDNHEPESAGNALLTYSKLIMPERNTEETIKRLTPLLDDPELQKKVNKAASDVDMTQQKNTEEMEDINPHTDKGNIDETVVALRNSKVSGYRLSQVIGIIIGSPEFQRR